MLFHIVKRAQRIHRARRDEKLSIHILKHLQLLLQAQMVDGRHFLLTLGFLCLVLFAIAIRRAASYQKPRPKR